MKNNVKERLYLIANQYYIVSFLVNMFFKCCVHLNEINAYNITYILF